jgi:signal peptidase I
MSDRLIGQPLPDNTADHESGRGEAAAPQHGETGDDVPDRGDRDSGARQGPSGGPGDSEHPEPEENPGPDEPTRPDGHSGPDEPTGPDEHSGPDEPAGSGGAGSGGRHGSAPAKARKRRSFWHELPVLIIVALLIALLIKSFVVQAFFIPSGSMENTLQIGDKILVNKLVYHFRSIQPGDVVVFDGAGSWTPEPPSHPSSDPIVRAYDVTLKPLFEAVAGLFGTAPGQTDFIKRVIGVPGDHVVCCNAQGLVTVNGVALHEQSYLYPGETPSEAPAGYSGRFNLIVPPGRLWVMGDNRAVSDDSRLRQSDPGHGTITESSVIGRAFMIVWPPSRWRILPIPSTFLQPGIVKPGSSAAGLPGAAPSGAVRIEPAAPFLPLAAGFAGAVPLTLLQRRLRRRRWRRRTPDAG